MGFWRVCWTGCLGMLCLIPMAWIGFNALDLGAAVTNGLFVELGPALDSIFDSLIPESLATFKSLIPILVEGALGVTMLLFFPLHWSLYYRPDEVGFAVAIIAPWILVGVIQSALFCKSAKKGFDSGMAVGVGYAIGAGIIPFVLFSVVSSYIGIDVVSVLDSVFSGMTDLPYLAAVILSTLEGGAICGIFGAFIGSLKYKPGEGVEAKPEISEPKFGAGKTSSSKVATKGAISSASSGGFCPNCGAKVLPGDVFCPNCGAKV
ncbi:MAG: zinc ribbon domain-containing protein [Promethearchaeota archaeon]